MLDLLNFEYPTQEELLDFEDLIQIGKIQWKVELAGYIWTLGSLWEYEYRYIVRKLNSYDNIAKERLLPVEVLNLAIVEVQRLSDNRIYTFKHEASKVKLRHLLLTLSPLIIDQLYKAYQIGEAQVKEEFTKKYSEYIDRISKGFFVEFGSYSGV